MDIQKACITQAFFVAPLLPGGLMPVCLGLKIDAQMGGA
jgi:hypothetical protein